MKKKALIIAAALCALLVGGCRTRGITEEVQNLVPDGPITTQTNNEGVTVDELEDNTYYVLHNDLYYKVYSTLNNYDGEEVEDMTSESRLMFYTTETEIYIPTLFVQNGDKLIFHSNSTLLDYLTWERYMDMGYTIGAYNINTMTSERCYLNTSEDADPCLVPNTEMYELYNLGTEFILLDKIGTVPLRKEYLKNGIIYNLKKSERYDLDIYTGTYYTHHLTTANVHAFSGMELFASIEYDTVQSTIYEIEIPEYFINGYYNISNHGILRIVYDESYSDATDFNVPLLEPGEGNAKRIYSTFPPLNQYSTTVENTLGYNLEEVMEEKAESTDILSKLQAATVSKSTLSFNDGEDVIITINSTEKTGDCYVLIGEKVFRFSRNGETYTVEIPSNKVKEAEGTLTISGFLKPYGISVVGCERK